jgi:hypothetical protein
MGVYYREYQEAFAVIKEFYNHAWATLLILVSIFVGIPGIANFVQLIRGEKRIAKLKKRLKKHARTYQDIEKKVQESMGGVLTMQGNIQVNDDDTGPVEAFYSYFRALQCFLDADNEKYIETALTCMQDVSNTVSLPLDFIRRDPVLKDCFENTIKKLKAKNKYGKYSDDIFYLNTIFSNGESK